MSFKLYTVSHNIKLIFASPLVKEHVLIIDDELQVMGLWRGCIGSNKGNPQLGCVGQVKVGLKST